MTKILILGDSCSLPRSFPAAHATQFEETYPYRLQRHFSEVDFCTISIGGAVSSELIGQAIAYFDAWSPDLIIVQAGIVDCRPEPVSDLVRFALNEFEFLQRFKAYVFKPSIMRWLIKWSPRDRVSKEKFGRNIKKLKSIFQSSGVLWLEIVTTASGGYESHRPGIIKRIADYNAVIKKYLKDGFVPLFDAVNEVHGVNDDHIHLNKNGHDVVFIVLKQKIENLIRRDLSHEI